MCGVFQFKVCKISTQTVAPSIYDVFNQHIYRVCQCVYYTSHLVHSESGIWVCVSVCAETKQQQQQQHKEVKTTTATTTTNTTTMMMMMWENQRLMETELTQNQYGRHTLSCSQRVLFCWKIEAAGLNNNHCLSSFVDVVVVVVAIVRHILRKKYSFLHSFTWLLNCFREEEKKIQHHHHLYSQIHLTERRTGEKEWKERKFLIVRRKIK